MNLGKTVEQYEFVPFTGEAPVEQVPVQEPVDAPEVPVEQTLEPAAA